MTRKTTKSIARQTNVVNNQLLFNHQTYIDFITFVEKRYNSTYNLLNSPVKILNLLEKFLVKTGKRRIRKIDRSRLYHELLFLVEYGDFNRYHMLKRVVRLHQYYDFTIDQIPNNTLREFIESLYIADDILSQKSNKMYLPLSNETIKRNGKNAEKSLLRLRQRSTNSTNINVGKLTHVKRVSLWTGGNYQKIQNARRNASTLNNRSILINHSIASVMTKMAYKVPYVPRGITKPKHIYRGVHGNFVLELLLSGEFQEKGYIPFTRNPYVAESFASSSGTGPRAVLRLNVRDIPRLTPWVWFDSCVKTGNRVSSLCPSEQEILLPPGVMWLKNFNKGLHTGVWDINFRPDTSATNLSKQIQIFEHMKPHHPMMTRGKSILQSML